MTSKFSKEELRRIIGPSRRKLVGSEYEEMRLILTLLEPYESGTSLHCWDDKYRYNGKVYQVMGELSQPLLPPIIEELDTDDFTDK